MSIMRCDRHQRNWDSDFMSECPECDAAAVDLPTPADETPALRDVIAERRRQKGEEKFTEAHDDDHSNGDLALAAACYAAGEKVFRPIVHHNGFPDLWCLWPWAAEWWKPKDHRRNLVRAGALILAEIERVDRTRAKGRKVITTFVDAPVPIRDCWQAHFDGDEPNDDGQMMVGRGATEREAVQDLIDMAAA